MVARRREILDARRLNDDTQRQTLRIGQRMNVAPGLYLGLRHSQSDCHDLPPEFIEGLPPPSKLPVDARGRDARFTPIPSRKSKCNYSSRNIAREL